MTSRTGRRLLRILALLPYAIQHPGISVADLAQRFGISERELIDDLNLVFVCGLPGYGPGDLIEVDLEDDSVYVTMADYFAAPLRLTPVEALSLYTGGVALADLPGMEHAGALRSALAKLGSALGIERPGSGIEIELEPGPAEHLETLQRALAGRRRVHLDYFSASRGELTSRDVDPWGLVAALGRWYLVAFDHLSSEERMFRLDRIRAVALLDEPAEAPESFDPEPYRGAFHGKGAGRSLSFEISPLAAAWFEDYYPVEGSQPTGDGWRRETLVAGGIRWAAVLVLRLGADVRAVEPSEVLDEARALAAAIAGRHRNGGG